MYIHGKEHLLRQKSFGKNYSEETIKQKRYFLDEIVKTFGNYQINKIRVNEIESFLLDDEHSGSWKNTYLDTFSEIYRETIWKCDKEINKPIFQKFVRNSKKADIFTDKELKEILNPKIWGKDTYYLFYKILAYCGLRLGEARAIKVEQIDFERKILIINGFCKRNGQRTNYNKKGSNENTKIRVTPIPTSLIEELTSYINKYGILKEEFLFMEQKKVLSGDKMGKLLKDKIKELGIPTKTRKLCPHSFRFTYVTLLRRKLKAEDIQQLVGHTTIKMTNYYTRQTIDDLVNSIQSSIPSVEDTFDI